MEGQFLYERRIAKDMSQGELAKKCGFLSSQFISNIERDLCGIPPEYIGKIAKVLDFDPESLIQLKLKNFELRLRTSVKSKSRIRRIGR